MFVVFEQAVSAAFNKVNWQAARPAWPPLMPQVNAAVKFQGKLLPQAQL